MGDHPGRKRQTMKLDQAPRLPELPRDRCTLIMLTGPTPGAVQPVLGDEVVLGRSDELPARIDDRGISARHARVFRRGASYWLEDLASTNGTAVNGVRLDAPWELRDGDRVQLGEHTLLRVSLHDATEQEATRRMYQAAVLDPLTGVYNRGHLDAVLVAEFAYAVRHALPLSVLFVDLDHFTAVNNTHGHQAGDAVLRATAQAIKNSVRVEDVVARYGGEEFVLVARAIAPQGALVLAERVRATIAEQRTPFHGKTLGVTASIGVACLDRTVPYATPEQLVAGADRAVYRAKAEGRNRVCFDTEPAPPSWRAPDER
jgi:diguanylate cyclase (GGDEF)-like protein